MDTNAYPFRLYRDGRLVAMFRSRANLVAVISKRTFRREGVVVQHENIQMGVEEVLGIE